MILTLYYIRSGNFTINHCDEVMESIDVICALHGMADYMLSVCIINILQSVQQHLINYLYTGFSSNTHTHTHARTHKHTCTHKHTHTQTHISTHKHTNKHTHTRTQTHTYTHSYIVMAQWATVIFVAMLSHAFTFQIIF